MQCATRARQLSDLFRASKSPSTSAWFRASAARRRASSKRPSLNATSAEFWIPIDMFSTLPRDILQASSSRRPALAALAPQPSAQVFRQTARGYYQETTTPLAASEQRGHQTDR